jgi:hypothetical protein
MMASESQAENDAIEPVLDEAIAAEPAEQYPPVSQGAFKRRLTERFSVPGTRVICHRRTIMGTWKASETAFHVNNVGMGGLNFYNLGMILKPGAKIKLTLLLPNTQPIELMAVAVWNKAVPHAHGGNGTQPHSLITGVKFVDYGAAAWAVLRRIPEIVQAQLKAVAPSEWPLSEDPSPSSLTTRHAS